MPEPHRPMFDDRELHEFAADQRRLDAVRSRDRMHTARELAATDLSMLDLLAELAHRRAEAKLSLCSGRSLRGRVIGTGGRSPGGRTQIESWVLMGAARCSLVRVSAVHALSADGPVAVFGDPRPAPTASFAAALAALADPGDEISLRSVDTVVQGTVASIGDELALLERRPGGTLYVPLAAVDEVTLSAASTYR